MPRTGTFGPAARAAERGVRTVLTATTGSAAGGRTSVPAAGLQPGGLVPPHFTDTLASDLRRALVAAGSAGRRPAGLIDHLR